MSILAPPSVHISSCSPFSYESKKRGKLRNYLSVKKRQLIFWYLKYTYAIIHNMNKKNKRNSLINYFFYFLTGLVILISFIIIVNILANCIKIFVENLPEKEPLVILFRQFQDINIMPIIIFILIAIVLSLVTLRKYKPMVHILPVLNITTALFLLLNTVLLFAGIMPIEETIELHSHCCAYLDSQPSSWFWVTIVLLAIVISLSFALLINTILNRFILKKPIRKNESK